MLFPLTAPLKTERVAVTIEHLPLALHGTTLVQLSDFHFDGYSLSPDLLATASAQCNILAPDLIVLTGDFITRNPQDIHALTAHLQHLQSRLGVYAVLGNHDSPSIRVRRLVQTALAAANIVPLWNDIAYPWGDRLPLVGLADISSPDCHPVQLLAQLPTTTPRLVLAHNPDTMDKLRSSRADLVLSGHTHGGQVTLPGGIPAPSLLKGLSPWLPPIVKQQIPFLNKDCDRVFRHWEWAAGLHTIGDQQLYVNRGLASYWPGRLFCPPELTVITLLAASSSGGENSAYL
ncbi:MAG: metallophosphoesterase [Leptolyngbyaceae cyanobacterium]